MHLTEKFHHPTFNHSEVIVLTNKLTNKQTDTAEKHPPHFATPVGKNYEHLKTAGTDFYIPNAQPTKSDCSGIMR